jgi:hypothetical protein
MEKLPTPVPVLNEEIKYDSYAEYKTDHPNKQVLLKYEQAKEYRGLGVEVSNFLNQLKDNLNALMFGENRVEYDPPRAEKNKHTGQYSYIYEGTKKMTKSDIADLRNNMIKRSETLWEDLSSMTRDIDYHVSTLDGYVHPDEEKKRGADNIVKLKSEGTND